MIRQSNARYSLVRFSMRFLTACCFVAIVSLPVVSHAEWPVLPPWQSASGPGGADYPWTQATGTEYINTQDPDLTYWIVAPKGWKGAGAAPAHVPLVVFLHGWGANHPVYYQYWLAHLARKGRIVVFPVYQNATTLSFLFASKAIASIQQAISEIGAGTPGANGLFLDPIAGMTVIGHSAGATTGINVAARCAASQLPQPRALLLVNPADWMLEASLADVPSTTLLDCIVGDADDVVGRIGCDAVWDKTGHISAANRNYIWMHSDTHGSPVLIANHFVVGILNALAFNGMWKLGDALVDCAADHTECATAVGGSIQQTSMGSWSDGVPIHPLSVTTEKPMCPAGSRAAGC
jgi:pimeloyl-ACP methyl ester carboxylesterase